MAKSTLFTGQPVFNQLLQFIPRSMVHGIVKKHSGDRCCKKFSSYDHLVTMLYAVLHRCSSLREVTTGMQASALRLTHLGLTNTPRRSTLADANSRRTAGFFEDLYHQLYQRYYGHLPDSLKGKRLLDKLFVVDSTIVTLFSSVLHSTGSFGLNGKKKGGIKAHVLLRAKNNVRCFVRLTPGKESDNKFLPQLNLPKGSIVVMDKGYRSYQQFRKWNDQQVGWVTRLHERAVYSPVACRLLTNTQRCSGVLSDTVIELGNPKTTHLNALQTVRLIVFVDGASKREFRFITNNFTYSAATIADIYRKRWQIELLFKRIKQNFQLHYFLGDSENAIRIQLWSALIADLLLKIVKDKVDSRRKWSMANLASLVRLHLGTYIDLIAFLINPDKALLRYRDPVDQIQLPLFPNHIRGA
jgi:hypothetical protein